MNWTAPRVVMTVVVVLEGLWLALVSLLYLFTPPLGVWGVIGCWVVMLVALYFFFRGVSKIGLVLSYAAFLLCGLLLAIGGSGPSHLFMSLYRDVPNLVFPLRLITNTSTRLDKRTRWTY